MAEPPTVREYQIQERYQSANDDEEYFTKNDFACRARLSFHYTEETVN